MDTISAICWGVIVIVMMIIFFLVCMYAGDAIAHRIEEYEEL